MENDDIISQSFNRIITSISYIGLYPPSKKAKFYTLRSYLSYFSLLVLIVVLASVNLFFPKKYNAVEFNDMCIFVIQTGFATLKILPFIANGGRVKKCIHYFGHPRFVARNSEEEKIVQDCVCTCQRNCKIYLYGVVAAVVLWLIPSFFSKDGRLPINVWLPYDARSSSGIFYSTFIFLLLANTYDVCSSLLTDPLIGSLSYHATTQLKILKNRIEHLDRFVQKGDVAFIRFDNASSSLKECVEHHNDILNFVAEFEHCFSWSIFWQLSGSVLILCFCGFGFTLMAPGSVDSIKYIICYFVILAQEFFFCYFGAQLLQENDSFMNAVCNGPWYKYDPKIRKMLFIMMERSKRSLIMTAGKVVNLNLQTFASILKTSYSMFAVLKSLQ